jgi:myo-inositol-1-phosphate synthase
VLALDIAEDKVGRPLPAALAVPPNNFPIDEAWTFSRPATVEQGISLGRVDEIRAVANQLRSSRADVFLLSLPSGTGIACRAYAEAALEAGVALVNCSADTVARDPDLLARFERAEVPLIGDDLASHCGSSLVHRELLDLLRRRGLTVRGTHQINLGGNEDFRNLRTNPEEKLQSKWNVLGASVDESAQLTIVPSAGHVAHLGDRKVAYINIEAEGWAGARVQLDVKLEVQDSSNAAGVIIDLVRIAATARRSGLGGFPHDAASLLKSPPRAP